MPRGTAKNYQTTLWIRRNCAVPKMVSQTFRVNVHPVEMENVRRKGQGNECLAEKQIKLFRPVGVPPHRRLIQDHLVFNTFSVALQINGHLKTFIRSDFLSRWQNGTIGTRIFTAVYQHSTFEMFTNSFERENRKREKDKSSALKRQN